MTLLFLFQRRQKMLEIQNKEEKYKVGCSLTNYYNQSKTNKQYYFAVKYEIARHRPQTSKA